MAVRILDAWADGKKMCLVGGVLAQFFDHVSELDLSSNKIRDTANCITGEVLREGVLSNEL